MTKKSTKKNKVMARVLFSLPKESISYKDFAIFLNAVGVVLVKHKTLTLDDVLNPSSFDILPMQKELKQQFTKFGIPEEKHSAVYTLGKNILDKYKWVM